ncbi:unnamed protein product [marine sediment metagenome]|uniref:Uncharacterized protein n=1 Tax=marine sediment metagenome TaxID=412755 RepID=X1MAX4_9ZZZZ
MVSIISAVDRTVRTNTATVSAIEEIAYVSEMGLRVSILTIDGKLLARWGNEGLDKESALFLAPHAIAVDSRGDLYVGEVSKTYAGVDKGSRVVQKFARKG